MNDAAFAKIHIYIQELNSKKKEVSIPDISQFPKNLQNVVETKRNKKAKSSKAINFVTTDALRSVIKVLQI